MTSTKNQEPTVEALQRLEEHLELPYVSGDLHAWSEALRQLINDAKDRVRAEFASEHNRTFDTIVKNHSNLRQQVEKLRQEDPEILKALDDLSQQADQFASGIDETVLAGQQFQAKREQLVNDGLSLVLRIRRQRAAINTWLGEAMQRDNGVGD